MLRSRPARNFLLYSVRPNIKGYLNASRLGIQDSDFNIEWNGALKVVHKEANLSINLSNNSSVKVCHDAQLDASKSNSLYVDDLSEIRVNALCGYMLIRYT